MTIYSPFRGTRQREPGISRLLREILRYAIAHLGSRHDEKPKGKHHHAIHDADDPLGYETAPPDVQLDPERVKSMMKYNEALKDAGVLVTLDGLHPPSMGARVSFASGKPVVTDGPFTEAKEVLGGYWMIEVNSKEEAIEWAKRCPASENEIIEIRQVQEMSDFSDEVQQAAAGFAELQRGSGR